MSQSHYTKNPFIDNAIFVPECFIVEKHNFVRDINTKKMTSYEKGVILYRAKQKISDAIPCLAAVHLGSFNSQVDNKRRFCWHHRQV